ncbi:hypothetical protein FB451DRAFT_1456778 [Mycena latifolia]|nr:hypothetical protein FB451DRAFT_1456778 [Mycena latifolia]
MSYGVVENPGLPKGYKLPKLTIRNGAPDPKASGLKHVFTTLPGITVGPPTEAWRDGSSECMLEAQTKAKILSTPGFPSPIARMGLGAFSTTRLQMGDLILSERPLVIAPVNFFLFDSPPDDFTQEQVNQAVLAQGEQCLQEVFSRLSPENKKAYMALANSHLQDGSGPLMGILRTNGLGAGDLTIPGDPPMRYSAVCKEISRLNHSCCPNTDAVFDTASFSYRLFAVRDIAPGEELTFSYTDISQPAAERQKKLEPYGFRCACRACRDPRTSDPRRETILQSNVLRAKDLSRVIILTPALMKTWAEEELQASPLYAEHANSLRGRYIFLGDADNALVYGRMLTKLKQWSCSYAKQFSDLGLIKSDPLFGKGSFVRAFDTHSY